MAKTIEELERELEKARNNENTFRGRFEKADGELKTVKTQLADLEAKQAAAEIPAAGAELLGVPGVQAVQHIVQRELGKQAPAVQMGEDRLSRVEAVIAAQARMAFSQAMDDYVQRVGGEPNFMRRIQSGGDMNAAWTAYAASPKGQAALTAFQNCDLIPAQMAVDSFMLAQARLLSSDAPPVGADAAVPPPRPMTEAEYDRTMARFDDRIRAGESPTKVNAERAAVAAKFAGL